MALKHVTLIRPPGVVHALGLTQGRGAPPLSLACLSAVLKRAGYGVTVIDAFGEAISRLTPIPGTSFHVNGITAGDIIERIPPDTDLIGVSCMFSNEWIAHRHVINAIAERFPGRPLIVGGEHATAAPEYVMACCPGVTACVLGEGEETLLELLRVLEDGPGLDQVSGLFLRAPGGAGFFRTADRPRIKDLDSLPWPDWEEVPLANYFAEGVGLGVGYGRNMPMLASRGCPYKCAFCSNPKMWGRRWNVRAVEDVIAEIRHLKERYGIDSVSFYDLTAIIRRDWILEFARRLIAEDLGITWRMPVGTRSEVLDEEVVALVRASGCNLLVYSPESGSAETLERIHKKVNLEKMMASMRACTRRRLFSKAHMVLGFPGETPRQMRQSLRFIARMAWAGLNDVAVFTFVPYPGSVFHDELKARGAFPREGEAYDLFLANNCSNNYSVARSWNEYIGDMKLRLLCAGASMMFYGLQYLFRPWRFFMTLFRLVAGRPTTLLERAVDALARRVAGIARARLRSVLRGPWWKRAHERPSPP